MAATPPPPPPPPHGQLALGTDIVVKLYPGHSIDEVTAAYPVAVDRALLASRGIYLVKPTDPAVAADLHQAGDLAHHIGDNHSLVVYAELDQSVQLADEQFHDWPWGRPKGRSRDATTYTAQPMVSTLQLDAAHATATGAGVTIAVLDTGADPNQPALVGRLGPGWNYIGDNANTRDVPSRTDDDNDGTINAGIRAWHVR